MRVLQVTILLSFSSLVLSGFGQSTITGVVTDAENEQSIPGVTVYSNSSRSGTTTGMDGQYSLQTQANDDSLTFSFIGYESQTVAIDGRSTIDIQLSQGLQNLDEFVVVAYGTQRKSDVTGAISTVGADEIGTVPATNAMQSLQGKVSGLQISAPSGAPGSSPVVRLRGVGTFNDASVLYVVDGVFTNDINYLSPSDIESISVLKDASATALYGSRGANGVIVVTTKRGAETEDGKPRFQFDAEYSLQTLPNTIDVLSGPEFADVLNQITPGSYNNINRVPDTDWQELIFRDYAPMQTYHFSFSGATPSNQYYFSLGYFKQEGIIPGSEYERVTVKLNDQYNLSDNMRVGVNLTLTPSTRQDAPDIIANAYRAWPTNEPYNADGSFAQVQGGGNPLATLEYTNNQTRRLNGLGNVFGEVDFLKDFTFRSSFGFEVDYVDYTSFTPVYEVGPLQNNVTNDLNKSRNEYIYWLWENTLSYNKTLGKHRFDALGGITSQQTNSEDLSASTQNLIDEDPSMWYISAGDNELTTASNAAYTTSMFSFLFRLNYTFDERFLFTGNFRRDGSSKFGRNNVYGNFSSVAVGWNIMNEEFMSNLRDQVQNLKIRASYGTVGNEKIAWDRQFTLVQNNQNVVLGQNEILYNGVSYGVQGNPNLQWESSEQLNIGLEVAVLENRLSAEVEYYDKTTNDILVGLYSPGHVGNGPYAEVTYNAASVKNNGVELNLSWRDDLDNGLGYNIQVIGSTVNNEVLEMGQLSGPGSYISSGSLGNGQLVTRTEVGGPIGAFYGYQVEGVFQNEEELNNAATLSGQQVGDLRFVDQNGDNEITEADRTIIGSYIPDFIYGLNLNVSYKGFGLGLNFYGQEGNEIYNGKAQVRPNQYNYEAQVANYWNGEGSTNTEPRPTSAGVNYQSSEYFVQDGSFFRLRTATLSYQIPANFAERINLNRASIYVRGTNIFTLSDFTGYSPEIASEQVLSSGIDMGTYPITSIYSVGINLSF